MKKEAFYTSPVQGQGAPIWWFARLCRIVFPPVFGLLFRPRIEGRENLPESGPYIIQANHASYSDPVFLWYGLKVKIRPMAKVELMDIPVVGGMAARVYAFPVNRDAADRGAIRMALSMLKRGEILNIFPQGTRVWPGEEAPFHSGGAMIASMANVPIVPIGIQNTEKIRPPGKVKFLRFPKVIIRIGKPIYVDDFAEVGKRERFDAITNEVMRNVFALRDNIPVEEVSLDETYPESLYPRT